jgi:hypothetical protein
MSLLDRLNEAGDFAPGWNPKDPGAPQQVIGAVTDIGQGSDFNGDPYLIYTIRQPDGERLAIHAFSTVLKQELAKYRIKLGSEIGVKYMGKPEGKNYYRYAVVSDAEFNLDPGAIDPGEAAAVKSDLESGGFKPVDFRPQSTVVSGDAANDPVPF